MSKINLAQNANAAAALALYTANRPLAERMAERAGYSIEDIVAAAGGGADPVLPGASAELPVEQLASQATAIQPPQTAVLDPVIQQAVSQPAPQQNIPVAPVAPQAPSTTAPVVPPTTLNPVSASLELPTMPQSSQGLTPEIATYSDPLNVSSGFEASAFSEPDPVLLKAFPFNEEAEALRAESGNPFDEFEQEVIQTPRETTKAPEPMTLWNQEPSHTYAPVGNEVPSNKGFIGDKTRADVLDFKANERQYAPARDNEDNLINLKDAEGNDTGTPILVNPDAITYDGKPYSVDEQIQDAQKTYDHQDTSRVSVDLSGRWSDTETITGALADAFAKNGMDVHAVNSLKNSSLTHAPRQFYELLQEFGSSKVIGGNSLNTLIEARYGTKNSQMVGNALTLALSGLVSTVHSEEDYQKAAEAEANDGLLESGAKAIPYATLDLGGLTPDSAATMIDASIKSLLGQGKNPDGLDTDVVMYELLTIIQKAGLMSSRLSTDGSGRVKLVSKRPLHDNYLALEKIYKAVFEAKFLSEEGKKTMTMSTQLTPPVHSGRDKDGKRTTANYSGRGKNVKGKGEIKRGQEVSVLPEPVIDFNYTLSQAPHYADPEIVGIQVKWKQALDNWLAGFDPSNFSDFSLASPEGLTQNPAAVQGGFDWKNKAHQEAWKTAPDDVKRAAKFFGIKPKTLTGKVSASNKGIIFGAFDAFNFDNMEMPGLTYNIWNGNVITALQVAAKDGKPRFNQFSTDGSNYRQHITGGEFQTQGSITARAAAAPAPTIGITTSKGKSQSVKDRFKAGNTPLLDAKDVKSVMSWGDFKNGKPSKPDGNMLIKINLIALAKNIIPRSRHVSIELLMQELTGDVVRKSSNDYLAVLALNEPEAYLSMTMAKNLSTSGTRIIGFRDTPQVIQALNNEIDPTNVNKALYAVLQKKQAGQQLSIEEQAVIQTAYGKLVMDGTSGPKDLQNPDGSTRPNPNSLLFPGFGKKTYGDQMRALKASNTLVNTFQIERKDPHSNEWRIASGPNIGWKHQLLSEMDMTSAGRMFAAIESGQEEVLKRGAYSESETGFLFEDGSPRTLAMDTVINYFINEGGSPSLSTEENARVKRLAEAFSKTRQEMQDRDIAIAEETGSKLEKLAANAKLGSVKAFDDWFWKTPLLTKDYGEALIANTAAAIGYTNEFREANEKFVAETKLKEALIAEGRLEEANEITPSYGLIAKDSADPTHLMEAIKAMREDGATGEIDWEGVVKDFDNTLTATLQDKLIYEWQSGVPKELSKLLAAINLNPESKGVFGEDKNIGQHGWVYDASRSEFVDVVDAEGRVIGSTKVIKNKFAPDPSATGKKKTSTLALVVRSKDQSEALGVPVGAVIATIENKSGKLLWKAETLEKNLYGDKQIKELANELGFELRPYEFYSPGAGTAAAAGVGPAFGQSDETAFFAYGNAAMSRYAPWMFKQDNYFMEYTFDNIKTDPAQALLWEINSKSFMIEVMRSNKTADFVKDNYNRGSHGIAEIAKRPNVVVGGGSEFSTITEQLDRVAENVSNSITFIRANINAKTDDGVLAQSMLESSSLRAQSQKLLAARYDFGLWAPVLDMELIYTDVKGNVVANQTIKKRDNASQRFNVKGSVLASFLRQFYTKNLDRDVEFQGRKHKRASLFSYVAAQVKPKLLQTVSKLPSGFLGGGLD